MGCVASIWSRLICWTDWTVTLTSSLVWVSCSSGLPTKAIEVHEQITPLLDLKSLGLKIMKMELWVIIVIIFTWYFCFFNNIIIVEKLAWKVHTHTHTHTHKERERERGSPMRTFFSLAYSLSVSNKSSEKTRQGFEPTIHLIVYRMWITDINMHKLAIHLKNYSTFRMFYFQNV